MCKKKLKGSTSAREKDTKNNGMQDKCTQVCLCVCLCDRDREKEAERLPARTRVNHYAIKSPFSELNGVFLWDCSSVLMCQEE